MTISASLCLLLGVASAASQDASDAPPWPARFEDPEPTPEETLLLALVNRFRADPAGMARTIRADPALLGRAPFAELDWQLFEDECHALAPSPPLVHELSLARPARAHALYTLANQHWGHEEREGSAHFTGRWPKDRLLSAGVAFDAVENAGTGRPGPWSMLAGLVVDDGPGGTGGMLPGRGHRRALHAPRARVGCAGIVLRERLSPFTLYVGEIDARFLGGVVFVDVDADGEYDVGEGLDGVIVTSGRAAIGVSWSSGGYGVPLADDAARSLVFTYRGVDVKAKLPPGSKNALIDVDFTGPLADACTELLPRLERMQAEGASPSRKRVLELLYLADDTALPGAVQERLSACAAGMEPTWSAAKDELRDLRERTLAAIDAADRRALKDVLLVARRRLRGAPQLAWFELAEEVGLAAAKLSGIRAPDRRDEAARVLRDELLPRSAAADLRARVRALGERR